MKKVVKLSMFLALFALIFTSCKDDNEGGGITVSQDGVYISGVAAGDIDVKFGECMVEGASFSSYSRSGMYELYYYLVAGDLEVKIIADDVETIYGPESALADSVMDGSDDQIVGTYQSGVVAAGSSAHPITEDGFYQIVFDETSMMLWVIPANKWEWNYSNTTLEMQAGASTESVSWELSDVTFATHSSKYRHSDGWKVLTTVPILAENEDLTDGETVIIFTNLGFNDSEALESGAGNTEVEKGIYTINLSWSAAEGFVHTMTKTGDVQNTDYSAYTMGLIGNGVIEADTAWGWSMSYQNQTPVKDGEIYTWTWTDITLAANGDLENSWKFREGDAWDFTVGYNDVTMSGSAASDFFAGSGDGNFGVATEATYDLELSVDADTDSWTLSAEPAAK